jgi:phosphate uptake regulator
MQLMREESKSRSVDEERYIRRLQLTGRGSYIVSVPKEWVQELGLQKGGEVELRRQQNHSLLLAALGSTRAEDEQSKCNLTIPPDVDPGTLTRKLLSLYLIGYSTIEVTSKSGNLTGTVRDSIREAARRKLVGTEVVTESSKSATLQVLLSSPQLWVTDALRRMSTIAGFMQRDAVSALANLDRDMAKQIPKIDDEVDRFGLYIVRQLKWAVQHPTLVEKIGLRSPVECLGYRMITKSVERSADHAVRIAENTLALQNPLGSSLLRDTNDLSQVSYKTMESALKALFTDDYQLAESVILEKEEIHSLEKRLVEHLLREKMPAGDMSAVRLILESLRRIGEYATDVAEIVLNLTVRRTLDASQGGSKMGKLHPLTAQEIEGFRIS